uniref:Pre-rRNA-processing protein RIX1 N-terminal domain-containing protein n=1 Tax=Heliothis virescens TaxID=7102 RepID=A0A2A4J5B6_HELVI
MSQILQKLRDVDPNDSEAVKEAITTFFQNLPKYTESNSNTWLRVLEDVITRFPRYCSQHRTTIEKYLVHFLDSSNYYNVIEAAKCVHGLQQIRPSQDKLASPKNCWREQMNILCNTAHRLIEAIFSNTVNIYKNKQNVKSIESQLLVNTPLTNALTQILNVKKSQGSNAEDRKMVLCNKLRNIFVFIQAMLVEVYPVAKPVQPQLILEVIMQALSVSSSVNTDVTEAVIVKTQALKTLNAMILCLGPNLIPFSGLVFRFVMQTLKWSSENPSVESRKVRVTAYDSLSKWLSMLHIHHVAGEGRGRAWEDDLTKHIVGDITPARKIVQLTMSNQYTKNLSKKAKRKLANSMLQQSTISSHAPGEKSKDDTTEEASDEVAIAALECAESFLTVSGIFLKPTTHKIFQERLIRECYSLQSYSRGRALQLLRALEASRKNTPPALPPPTHYCLQLYSMLVNSSCEEIRKFSSQALLDIRLHLHCSPPSINFALEPQTETRTDKSNRKEISKKNRKALEALLGKDRMPDTEELEEPQNKIPRLEEGQDRISISSESSPSVVISDDEVEVINQENTNTEVDDVELMPVETIEDSSPKISRKRKASDTINIEDTVDTTESNKDIEIDVPKETANIYEAKTQVPLNTSTDTIDGDKSPVSLEIAYGASNTDCSVKRLEKLDDDNLPSTNDTDDVQITCGQVVAYSQESAKDTVEVGIEISAVKTNKIDDAAENEETKQNGDVNDNIEVTITSKEVTVEDMLADFVDEVIEEPSLVT